MREIRLGLAGCGLFGESHLQAMRAVTGARVVAVYDPNAAAAGQRAQSFGVDRICASIDELCSLAEVDAVDVVTPEHLHLDPVLKAIEAGKHVFVEKPLATDLEHCQRMIDAAAGRGRILMVGQILRFETKYAMLRDEVASGKLGKIVSMYARRNRPVQDLARYARNHPAIETSIHDIDLMLWYSGDRVRRVRGYGRNATGGQHHDTFWGVIEFEGGALGVVETIWLLREEAGVRLDDAFQLTGDRGTANVNLVPGPITYWRDTGYEAPDFGYDPRVGGGARGALCDELAYFCNSVRAGRMPTVIRPCEASNAVRVALALIESAYRDAEIEIQEWN